MHRSGRQSNAPLGAAKQCTARSVHAARHGAAGGAAQRGAQRIAENFASCFGPWPSSGRRPAGASASGSRMCRERIRFSDAHPSSEPSTPIAPPPASCTSESMSESKRRVERSLTRVARNSESTSSAQSLRSRQRIDESAEHTCADDQQSGPPFSERWLERQPRVTPAGASSARCVAPSAPRAAYHAAVPAVWIMEASAQPTASSSEPRCSRKSSGCSSPIVCSSTSSRSNEKTNELPRSRDWKRLAIGSPFGHKPDSFCSEKMARSTCAVSFKFTLGARVALPKKELLSASALDAS